MVCPSYQQISLEESSWVGEAGQSPVCALGGVPQHSALTCAL